MKAGHADTPLVCSLKTSRSNNSKLYSKASGRILRKAVAISEMKTAPIISANCCREADIVLIILTFSRIASWKLMDLNKTSKTDVDQYRVPL